MAFKIASQSSQNSPSEQVHNILLFGETGSGKSTLINYLTNYFKNGTLRELKIMIPMMSYPVTEGGKYSERDFHDSSKSKTSGCFDYDFSKDGLLFSFTDTPGLSDTEGVDMDELNIKNIMIAAERRGTLAAIIIVINGTQSRATVTMKQTLFQLKNSVPDSFLDNLIVVLTHCSKNSTTFSLEQLKPWRVTSENVFHMNNMAFCTSMAERMNDQEAMSEVEVEWNKSMRSINKLVARLKQLGKKATDDFVRMRLKRNEIMSNLHQIMQQMKQLQDLHNKLDYLKREQQDICNDIEKYSNYKRTTQVEYVEFEDSDYFSTICSRCLKVCNEDWTSKSSLLGIITTFAPKFITDQLNVLNNICKSLRSPHCEKCNCSHFAHYEDCKKPVKKTRTVEEILHDVKSTYDQQIAKNDETQSQISVVNADIESLCHALDAKEKKMLKCCNDLKEICSYFNLIGELEIVIKTMQSDTITLTSPKARDDANRRIANIQDEIEVLSRNQL